MSANADPPPSEKRDRSIRLVRPPDQFGIGVFQIRAGGRLCYYTFRELPCEIGGRGFALHRLGIGQLYHVRIGKRADCSCECTGFLFRGYCRHILGLMALERAGQLTKHPGSGRPK